MLNKFKFAIAFSTFAFLAACGGGGEFYFHQYRAGSSTSTNTGPVASTATFNLLVADGAEINKTSNFTISGALRDGTPVIGSGKAVVGNFYSDTFEGRPAFKRTTLITGNMSGNGQSVPLSSSSDDFTDSTHLPLGFSGTEYMVVTGVANVPIAARVGDKGTMYTANRYTSSSKKTLLGTTTTTYAIEADTANTALVTTVETKRDTTGVPTTNTSSQSRINTANALTKIKETGVNYTTGVNLTFTYQ